MARCRCRAHMHAVPTTTRCPHRATRTSRQHCTAAPHACGVILPCSTEECLGSCWRRARLGRAGVRAQQRPGPRGGPARDFLCSPAGARVRRGGPQHCGPAADQMARPGRRPFSRRVFLCRVVVRAGRPAEHAACGPFAALRLTIFNPSLTQNTCLSTDGIQAGGQAIAGPGPHLGHP